jgi:hypothetical protein
MILLIFAAVIQQWSAVFDHLEKNLLGPCASGRRMSTARFTPSRIGESTSQIACTLYFTGKSSPVGTPLTPRMPFALVLLAVLYILRTVNCFRHGEQNHLSPWPAQPAS